jgi:hypothetical protein
MTWPEYLMAVISWQQQQESEEEETEPVSGIEAMRRIRAARDSVTSQ